MASRTNKWSSCVSLKSVRCASRIFGIIHHISALRNHRHSSRRPPAQRRLLRGEEATSHSRKMKVPSRSVPPTPVHSDTLAWKLYALSTYFASLLDPPVSTPTPWIAVTLRAVHLDLDLYHLEPQRCHELTNEWRIFRS